VLYLAGWAWRPRAARLISGWTLGSEKCVDDTVSYFRRFAVGDSAGAYSTGVRLSAGDPQCAATRLSAFFRYDIAGSLVYATLWVTVGYLFGDQVSCRSSPGVAPTTRRHPDHAGSRCRHRGLTPVADAGAIPAHRGWCPISCAGRPQQQRGV